MRFSAEAVINEVDTQSRQGICMHRVKNIGPLHERPTFGFVFEHVWKMLEMFREIVGNCWDVADCLSSFFETCRRAGPPL